MNRAVGRWAWFVVLGLLLALAVSGCRTRKGAGGDAGVDNGAPPAVTLREDSQGLLLTWIDEKGDFHVEQSAADVPMLGRDVVRVVDPQREDGTHDDRVFLADMRVGKPDGTFPIKAAPRAEFDAIAGARRAKIGQTMASAAAPANDTPPSSPDDPVVTIHGDPPPGARPLVIIYGADWCGACHEAAAYLRRKGVAFVEKNVERDHDAAREMNVKLSRSGLHAGSIPVLDVKGKIMVGFNPQSVDEALGKAI